MSKGFRDKVKKGLLTTVFFLVLSIGTVCLADEVPGTVLGDSCNIRETTDASGRIIGNAKKNATVSIIGEVTGNDGNQWYQVWVDGTTKGYIRADLVKKGEGTVAATTTQPAAIEAELPATQATPVDEKAGTVNTNNVRIRKGASTQHGVVATANKGMQLTVTGEATGSDGKQWYQVKFPYNNKEVVGFIRSDLVTFGSVPADAAVSEITGSQIETPAPEQQEENVVGEEGAVEQPEEVVEPEPEPEPQANNNANDMTLMNTNEVPYIMSGFVPIILKWKDQDINAFKNGDFYIFYAQNASGEQGWFVFDSVNGTYQRYVYASEGVEVKDDNLFAGNLIPIIILVVIIVILLAIVGLMFIRLKEYTSDTYEEDESDEEEFENDEELELEEEEIEEEIEEVQEERIQKPKRPQKSQKPQRVQREEPEEEIYDRPVRKTNSDEQRPVRRPNAAQRPNPSHGVDERMQQPKRVRVEDRDPMERKTDRPVRRPGDRPVRYQNSEPVRRRPSGEPGQRRPVRQAQAQGYRAQNFLENEDKDDIEFIDL